MNRILPYLETEKSTSSRSSDSLAFRHEARVILRSGAGLGLCDVHLFIAGFCNMNSQWEIKLHLTESEIHHIGSDGREHCLSMWRDLMPVIERWATERGIRR